MCSHPRPYERVSVAYESKREYICTHADKSFIYFSVDIHTYININSCLCVFNIDINIHME